MRVITGSARGRRLGELKGMETRPTTDKVKESIFNCIQFDVEDARVLDLFAGTGQLGIEALSRGAKSALFVDKRADAVKLVRENLALCRLTENAQIICGDFNSGIENAPVACLRDAGWQEAYEAVHGPGEAGFTYHGFKGPDYRKKNARRIDFIFVRGNLQPVAAEILRDKVDGLYPSDHYFLMSDFIIQ